MKFIIIFFIFILKNHLSAFEVYEQSSGVTFLVGWCNPISSEITEIQYKDCNDNSQVLKKLKGACSNYQSDCTYRTPSVPLQTDKSGIKFKMKKWDYFDLDRAKSVGYPAEGEIKPASMQKENSSKTK